MKAILTSFCVLIYKMSLIVNQCIDNDIKSSEGGKYYEEKADIKEIENIVFYILDGEIHIVFNEYELAPYVSGVIDLILCDCKW